MSDTVKRPYAQVMRVAEVLVSSLLPACHRIEIAGSLRRERPLVGDIEIVAIPQIITKTQANLFGEPLSETAESMVDGVLESWPLTFHKNGPKYKQFSFEWQPGWTFKVDLFLQPDPATWGWNFMIRTGSADFSKKMVVPCRFGGYKPEWATVEGARVWREGKALDTREESHVFELWGMEFIEPKDRL